jgi:hypothetical protein
MAEFCAHGYEIFDSGIISRKWEDNIKIEHLRESCDQDWTN